mgnify:CR=1 FL=1
MKRIAYIAVVALAVVACNKEEGGAKIDSIKVVPETKTLYTDEALPELAVVLEPEDADVTVEWTSSDPETVTVSDKGELAFAVKDIEDAEKTVTITAKAGDKTATCVLTVKGQISRYEVLDLTETLGVKLLDRNVGAKSSTEIGNFYQWGKNTPVAANDETAVNTNYDAAWGPTSEGFADWTVAENTPCPKGWSLPNDEQMTKIDKALENIALWDMDFCTREEYEASCAALESMKLVGCGQFKNGYTDKKYLADASYFWTSYTFTDSEGKAKIGTFENNLFPTYSKKSGCAYDVAMPVRCVK